MQNASFFVESTPSPFRKRIWKKTTDYHFSGLSEEELGHVSRVYDVMAGKLQIAFPTRQTCLDLVAEIGQMPDDPTSVEPASLILQLEQYLTKAKRLPGVQIPVAMCMLAVEKGGRYAPTDVKVAAGLCVLQVVTDDEAKALIRSSVHPFANVYVKKVLPAWHRELERRAPEEVDAYWGSHAPATQ